MFQKIIIALSLCLVLLPAVALAKYGLEETRQASVGALPLEVAGSKDVPTIIGNVVGNGLALLGVVFFLLMLYGGVTWMIAKGDTAKVDSAKEIIQAAVIGLVLVLAAYAIATFVFSQLVSTATTAPPAETPPAAPAP